MIIDGFELLKNSHASNFSVESGPTLSTTDNELGELFYLTAPLESVGLYVYNGTDWKKIGNELIKLVAGPGILIDQATNTISSNIPQNATTGQVLSYSSGPVWITLTKSSVGLANVDNTSDADKPISNAVQSAINSKADKVNPVFSGTVSGITKSHVGLANVDNTSDANKPISTATQNALDLTEKLSNKNQSNGYVGLVNGKIPVEYIPSSGVTVTSANITDSTSVGRAVLTAMNAAAARSAIGAGTSNFDGAFASLTAKPTTILGYGITDARGPKSVSAVKTSNFAAVSGVLYPCDTSAGSFIVDMPASPNALDEFYFFDQGKTFNTNNLILNRNGNLFFGLTENCTIDMKNRLVTVRFFNAAFGYGAYV